MFFRSHGKESPVIKKFNRKNVIGVSVAKQMIIQFTSSRIVRLVKLLFSYKYHIQSNLCQQPPPNNGPPVNNGQSDPQTSQINTSFIGGTSE